MEIKYVKISEIIFAEYNPRKMDSYQKKHIMDSLSRFGFVDPVIINENSERSNILVGGHQRIKCWQELGHDTVPAVFVDLSYDKERELNIRLNKNTGDWDLDVLKDCFEMDELKDWGFLDEELEPLAKFEDFSLDSSFGELMSNNEQDRETGQKSETCTCPKCGTNFKP